MNQQAVSLFTNCGAGDLGYYEAGFQFRVVADIDPRRLEVAVLNHPKANSSPGDLRDTWEGVVQHYREQVGEPLALLAACPPCQGMSSVNSDRGQGDDPDAGSRDERNLLVIVIANVAKELQPQLIVVENVPAFLTRKVRHPETCEPVSAANLLIARLSKHYVAFPFLANLAEYGIPQSRKRTFLTFVRKDVPGLKMMLKENWAPYPFPTHDPRLDGSEPIKLKDALKSFELPSLDAETEDEAFSNVQGGLHSVPVWQDRRYPMVAAIPPNSGASAWENQRCQDCGEVEVGNEDATCPNCGEPLLRPVVLRNDGTYRLVKGFRSSSYRRMDPDKPAATITTASGHIGSSSTIHPFENRLLSPLECAYLQTFPEDFDWGDALEKYGHTNIRIMIGEAVPPKFTQMHGQILMKVLSDKWDEAPISLDDDRCVIAIEKLNLPADQDPRQIAHTLVEVDQGNPKK